MSLHRHATRVHRVFLKGVLQPSEDFDIENLDDTRQRAHLTDAGKKKLSLRRMYISFRYKIDAGGLVYLSSTGYLSHLFFLAGTALPNYNSFDSVFVAGYSSSPPLLFNDGSLAVTGTWFRFNGLFIANPGGTIDVYEADTGGRFTWRANAQRVDQLLFGEWNNQGPVHQEIRDIKVGTVFGASDIFNGIGFDSLAGDGLDNGDTTITTTGGVVRVDGTDDDDVFKSRDAYALKTIPAFP
jgi:hypothetical protein